MEKPHALIRLWQHALKKAGTAVEADAVVPPLPKLKMRDLAWALLHFAELLEGMVPLDERAAWNKELTAARMKLLVPAQQQEQRGALGAVDHSTTWTNLAQLMHQAAHRAVHAPSLANVAQRGAVGAAFTLFRKSVKSRTEANEQIRRGLERLEAGAWIAAARERGIDAQPALENARGLWGGAHHALFEDQERRWWLVRMTPGRPVAVETGERDDLLACIPDSHFTSAVRAVLSERG